MSIVEKISDDPLKFLKEHELDDESRDRVNLAWQLFDDPSKMVEG
jgi:hypothetical protein